VPGRPPALSKLLPLKSFLPSPAPFPALSSVNRVAVTAGSVLQRADFLASFSAALLKRERERERERESLLPHARHLERGRRDSSRSRLTARRGRELLEARCIDERVEHPARLFNEQTL